MPVTTKNPRKSHTTKPIVDNIMITEIIRKNKIKVRFIINFFILFFIFYSFFNKQIYIAI